MQLLVNEMPPTNYKYVAVVWVTSEVTVSLHLCYLLQ